ncbi:hypothetical protein ACFUNF_04790 [Streptomyces sp. NPDC057291]|uniref:hypothetical protein n=1 Tax=Streptomyces sp. NPDC057291 TaxID=3346087 RepID=UPI003644F4A5
MPASLLVAGKADGGLLLGVLRELNIEDVWVLHNDLGDRFMLDPVPDFVVGVLTDDENSPRSKNKTFTNGEVSLRLGLAAGRGVPALAIVPPTAKMRSPDPLIMVAACDVHVRQALADHLWAFTATLDFPPPSSAPPGPIERGLENADEYLAVLNQLEWGSRGFGGQFERLMGRVLMSAGAAVAETKGSLGDRVDLAFVPSGGSTDIILVELKAGHLSEATLSGAEEQLQRFVIERQAKYGIVLYHDTYGRSLPNRHSTPLIVRMSARELIQRLAGEPLPKVLDAAVVEAVGRM